MHARVRAITVSSVLDSYVNGVKHSTFISAKVDLQVGSWEEFRIEHMKAGMEVAIAAVQNAMCRQDISETEARTRVAELKENYSGMIKRMEEIYASKIEEDLKKVNDFLEAIPVESGA
jgi:uncharacterized protein YdaT